MTPDSGATIRLENNQGSVWIDGGRSSVGPSADLSSAIGSIQVENCNDVTILRTRLSAPACSLNCPPAPPGTGTAGAHAIDLINSEVQLYDCWLTGGAGLEGYDPVFPGGIAGDGGDAARLVNSTLNIFSSTLIGGAGGSNSQSSPAPFCADGGDGGAALYVEDVTSLVRVQDSSFTAGNFGLWTTGLQHPVGCTDGVPGVLFDGPGANQVVQLLGTHRSLLLSDSRAIIEGEPFTITSQGQPGDILFLGVGVDHDPIFQAPFFGTAAFAPLTFVRIGKIGASGFKSLKVAAGDIIAPGESATVFLQAYHFDTNLNLFIGSPIAIALLDDSHNVLDGCNPIIYVDDNAPNDPSPIDPTISDPLEDGSAARPFDDIQEAIDSIALSFPYVIRVADGAYGVPVPNGLALGDTFVMIESEDGPDSCTLHVATNFHAITFDNPAFTTDQGIRGLKIRGATDTAVDCINSTVTIDNCILENNIGEFGGAINLIGGNSVVSNCLIRGNTSTFNGSAGIYAIGGAPLVHNCTIVGNTSPTPTTSAGGAVLFSNPVSSPSASPMVLIRNCTVADNVGGGVHFISSSASQDIYEVPGMLVWGNTGGFQIRSSSISIDLPYSNVQGGLSGISVFGGASLTTGPGFINVDPLFVDPAMGDYHLSAGSPCIDAGDPNFVALPGETDIDGEARVQGAAVDLGSDEQ